MRKLLWLCFLLSYCQPATEKMNNLTEIEQIAFEKYTDKYILNKNTNGSHTLCIKHEPDTKTQPFTPLSFFIFDNTENKVVFEDNLPNGDVEWLNDFQIKVTTFPGIVQPGKENPRSYIFDINSGKKN
ncbi:MAG: hypothetical protein H6627_10235 [Calditrichae bacterium]|nr:hypothetical protein [Calditrichia bacterium]